MRHVLVLSTLWPNPVAPRFGTFVARSLEALAKRGDWRVTVINPIGLPPITLGRYRDLAEVEDRAEEGGLTVHRPRFTLIPRIGGRRNGAAIARAALPLAREIHDEQPIDLVDAQFFFPDGPAAARIARALDRPFSIKARGSDITYWGTLDYAREQMLRAAKRADGLLAVSAALKREMEALGMEGDKITVHYTGLDRDRFRPLAHTQLRAQLGGELGIVMPDNAPLLICVGALIERKGQHIALDALTEVPGAHLVLVGQGEQEGQLKGQARALGLADRVHFVGLLDHDVLPLMLSAADAMVLPSANEGLANAWVEALACGTPVVTCDVGGAREVITSELAGRLVPRDPKAVAAGINAVLNDPPPRQAVADLVERFSWEENAARLADYYESLLAAKD
ncbi:Glycosyltransferase [Erythrobacter litoralis]|uniref:Glycoside hydrolase n=1 Tax=Erythrobacter litoralis TaxID=39960 RepID=A0A074NLB4_9SPHN|nr:glycosyltransferase [Erythrobacter litoralis]AOL23959.1 Glycosyltransferase [Erythrobacter litoralis]KEO98562.1 glycoside hydrolase [Erythrobacter litoralis]